MRLSRPSRDSSARDERERTRYRLPVRLVRLDAFALLIEDVASSDVEAQFDVAADGLDLGTGGNARDHRCRPAGVEMEDEFRAEIFLAAQPRRQRRAAG